MTIIEQLARELNRPAEHIENVVRLLDEGNTIPFIARYRKELHGSMDDTALRTLEERPCLSARSRPNARESVKTSIAEQEQADGRALAAAIDAAQTLAEVEDLYRPYKPKRRTRATVARKRGLSRLRRCYSRRSATVPDRRKPPRTSSESEKGVETACGRPTRAQTTSWPSGSATTRPSASRCASCWKARHAPLPRRDGGGQRLPPVLRFRAAAQPSAGAPDPRHQPRREGGKAAARPSCWTASWRCRCCGARW